MYYINLHLHTVYSLYDDAMYLQDDYFHGVISTSYSCGYYIKYLNNDTVAVAYVTW